MIKSELVCCLHEQNQHLHRQQVERIVDGMLDAIADAMTNGRRVELRGFGIFAVKHRSARIARNPLTGVPVSVKQKSVPAFKSTKEMHRRLNPSEALAVTHSRVSARYSGR